MSQPNTITIPKNPQLPLAEDYFALRERGFSYLEELGSEQWTDFNAHDPGITTLEALCYALSELGYRMGFDIADLLTEESGLIGFQQAFFTARRILTNNPLTIADFRKILIDLPGVSNGWLLCKSCPCESKIYAECGSSSLSHAPLWRLHETKRTQAQEHAFHPQGLYDILLELERDPELGDLNNRKISYTSLYELPGTGELVPVELELRFPREWEAQNPEGFSYFVDPGFTLSAATVTRFSRDRELDEMPDQASFERGWDSLFFVDFEIELEGVPEGGGASVNYTLSLERVTLRFFSPKGAVRRAIDPAELRNELLPNTGNGGILSLYRSKRSRIFEATEEARFKIHQYRNLGEDFCAISGVYAADIGVCMDVETTPEADVEMVWAQIFNAIELYFNPPVPFYTLQELVEEKQPVEAVFDGPALENGFIKKEELQASDLKSAIYVSDLIDRIMDIPGVQAVKHLQLTRYDEEGQAVATEEPWKLPLRAAAVPRLYEQASRILFYKNSLPLLPRVEEAKAILTQLRGERSRAKIPIAENDFRVPKGEYRDLAAYYPVQHTFPDTYGIGEAGLPVQASSQRQAEAAQFKGYLMVFEQALGDMYAQLANAKALFSLDESESQTYFQNYFDPTATAPGIAGLSALFKPGLSPEALGRITESEALYQNRRNRFLDHLLARFGEQFQEYALMLYSNADRIPLAPEKLIRDKVRFLKDYPRISALRAKAFNYKDEQGVCDLRNRSGLSSRISRLLGMEYFRAYFDVEVEASEGQYYTRFFLRDPDSEEVLLESVAPLITPSLLEAEQGSYALIGDVMANSILPGRYAPNGGETVLQNEAGESIARLAGSATESQVIDFASALLEKERLYIVEHLLLRPKFPGDALMPVCLEEDCEDWCGQEDPYSFRLTYVLQGSLAPFSQDIDLRRFADELIRKETPSHLLPKICWVGNSVCLQVDGQAILCDMREVLVNHLLSPIDSETEEEQERIRKTLCECADEAFAAFNASVAHWGTWQDAADYTEAELQQEFESLFQEAVPEGSLPCHGQLDAAYYQALQELIVPYFANNLDCYQFNRFERAWCRWLEANAAFNWSAESDFLYRRTEQLLTSFSETSQNVEPGQLCRCAELLLGYFGNRFRAWVDSLVEDEVEPEGEGLSAQLEGTVWDDFRADLAAIAENGHAFCEGLLPEMDEAFWEELRQFLADAYSDWIVVSYRLNELIRIFTDLKSVYPSATLHDCDDGSDDNPVRLNNTILGSI